MIEDTNSGRTALVLSGGGSRGSWEVGFLKYLGEVYGEGFNIIGGTSVGSINAVGLAMFRPENFSEATDYVHKLWTEKVTKTSDIWVMRQPWGLPALWNPSVGTNDALEKLLVDAVDINAIKASGITLRLPAADLEAGKIVVFDVADLEKHGIQPVMASASFPLAFPPVDIAGQWLTDGGVIDMAPVGAAIKAGAKKILVLSTRSPDGVAYKPRHEMKGIVHVAERLLDIMTQTVLEGNLKVIRVINALVEAGHPMGEGKAVIETGMFGPSKPLGGSLDFSGDLMQAQMGLGYEDAKRAHTEGALDFLVR